MATSSPSPPKVTRGKAATKTNGSSVPARAVSTEEPKKAAPVMASAALSAEDIARRAYEIYEREGRQPGTDLQNWLKAEAELGLTMSH